MSIDEELEKEFAELERQRPESDEGMVYCRITPSEAYVLGYRAALGKLEWKKPEARFYLVAGMEVVDKHLRRWRIGELNESGDTSGCGCCSDREVVAEDVIAYRELPEQELPEWARIRLPEE